MTPTCHLARALVLSALLACPLPAGSQDEAATAGAKDALRKIYNSAIDDAAVIEEAEIAPLPLLENGRVRMVTWTKFPDSYVPGQSATLSWGELWVSPDGPVREKCHGFASDTLDLRIRQLLGLPPGSEARWFVTMDLASSDLFRPCANPDIFQDHCGDDLPAAGEHLTWYARQAAQAYRKPHGYPWTRLGYTFDWNPETTEYGVPEYVVRKGAVVQVIDMQETSAYCRAQETPAPSPPATDADHGAARPQPMEP